MRRFEPRSYVVAYYGFMLTDDEFNWIEAHGLKINTGIRMKKILGGSFEITCVGIPGYPGSCINHRQPPNVEFSVQTEKRTKSAFLKGFLMVKTLGKPIEQGQEFFIDYGADAQEILKIQ
jgi:hypothetical protein